MKIALSTTIFFMFNFTFFQFLCLSLYLILNICLSPKTDYDSCPSQVLRNFDQSIATEGREYLGI